MSQLKHLFAVLDESTCRNGNIPVTLSHLRNIVRLALRQYENARFDYLQRTQADHQITPPPATTSSMTAQERLTYSLLMVEVIKDEVYGTN